MSKPPFIIRNRKGIKLWPQTMQLPSMTHVHFAAEGLTGPEIELAREIARQALTDNEGRLKQFYLRMSNAYSDGITNVSNRTVQMAPNMVVRYSNIAGHERMDVKFDARGIIEDLQPEKTSAPQPTSIDLMWLIDTTGSTAGGENAPVTREDAIEYTKRLNAEFSTNVFRAGIASVGDFPVDPFGGPEDKPYELNHALSGNYAWTLTPFGGNDAPEAQLDAVYQCINDPNVGWSPWGVKIVIVSTDQTYHVPADGGPHIAEAALNAALTRKQVQLRLITPTRQDYINSPTWDYIAPDSDIVEAIKVVIDQSLLLYSRYGITP